ncbi:MAG: DEAD/DEAH box helicase [Ignavibacteria bacterium]|nr:DEAD/DEAH box helicase [Ignavibacteria bacterium]
MKSTRKPSADAPLPESQNIVDPPVDGETEAPAPEIIAADPPAAEAEAEALPDFAFSSLPQGLFDIVQRVGWTEPTPVQAQAIPYLMRGTDLIVQAKTGSGKTGAYLLPIIQSINTGQNFSQALILVPTRELARQVFAVLEQLTENLPVRSALLYGGVGYNEQNRQLREGAHIVVGTPGRVLDHIFRGTFTLQRIAWLVLDEADELLSMGFLPALRKLRSQLPQRRQTVLCSATIPYHVEELARVFLHNPDRLILSKGAEVVSTLEHSYYIVPPLQKDRMLLRLLEKENPDSAIVFCNTKRSVEYLAEVLKNSGYDAKHLTGDVAQNTRERTVQQMHDGTLRFIVATDVIARGIDISDLSHVILYDIPEHTEVYVHRSGRTARAGKTGVAITLCEDIEERRLLGIARQYNFSIAKGVLPTPEEVSAITSERLIIRLETEMTTLGLMEKERLPRYLPLVENLIETDEGKLLLAMMLDRVYLQGMQQPIFSPEPERVPASPKQSSDRGDRGRDPAAGRKPRPRR